MKVCYQCVQHLELVPRIDENICPSGAGTHGSILRCLRFYRAAAGGTHADDPPAVFFVSLIRSAVSWGDHTVFTVHGVVGDLVLFHRAEGPKSHMECNVSYLYTNCLYSLSSGVKCSPAVGAAAEPLTLEYTV